MRVRAPVLVLTMIIGAMLSALFIGGVLPLIGIAHATSGCNTPPGCQVNANTNVPASDGTIWVTVDNNTGSYCASVTSCTVRLPQTFYFVNNTSHSIQVLNTTFNGPSTGGQYQWKDWITPGPPVTVWTTNQMLKIGPILYNYTGPAAFTAEFNKQFHYALSFNDASGNPLSPVPTSVALAGQTGGTITITQYSGYLNSNLYTVTQATWEGSTLTTTSPVQIDLTSGSTSKVVPLQAYPASVHVVDNNNNPISGANVTVTFINSTSRSIITDGKGNVQLGDIPKGSYSLSVVYQNHQVTGLLEDAITNPTVTVQLNVGSSAASTTTSAIVLLTIFGLAFFLILLAIKVRKPPPPPTI